MDGETVRLPKGPPEVHPRRVGHTRPGDNKKVHIQGNPRKRKGRRPERVLLQSRAGDDRPLPRGVFYFTCDVLCAVRLIFYLHY